MRICTPLLCTLSLAGLLSLQPATAQNVVDTLDVTMAFESWRTDSGLYKNCGTWAIGIHDDPIGRGLGTGNYTYTDGISSHNTPVGASQDIPGTQVAVLISPGNSGSRPGRWPACGSFASLTAAAWAGTTFKAYYTVAENQPIAKFEWEQIDSTTVRLDGSESHVTSAEGPIPVSSYEWSYGNDRAAAITEHTFSTFGDFEVSLTVTNDDGDENTMTRTVTLTPYRLTVTPEVMNPQDLYTEGDSLIVEVTVENTGEESVFNVVVPHFTDMLSEGTVLPPGARLPRQASASIPTLPDPEQATVLEEGETIVFSDTLIIDQHTHYNLDGEWIHQQVEAWVEYFGDIEAESIDPDNLPVKIIHECKDASCGTFTVGPELYRVDGLRTRSVGNLDAAQAGALPGPTWGSVSFAQFDPDGTGGHIPQCRSGCIEIEAPIVKEDGSPADAGVTTKVEVSYVGVKPSDNGFGGDFVCERVSIGHSATCISEPVAGDVLEVETGDDGVARAWYAIPGALMEDGTLEVDVSVAGLLYDDTYETTTASITVEDLYDETITLTPAASIFGRANLALNTGASWISIGEWCGWLAAMAADYAAPKAKAQWKRNVARLYFTNAVNWVCGKGVSKAKKASSMVTLLQEIADGTVVLTDLALFTWFAQGFQIDKASDLVTYAAFADPFFFRPDGDILGFVKGDLVSLTTSFEPVPQPGNNLVLQEATGIVDLGGGTVETHYFRPQYNNGALHLKLATPNGDAETTISYGYVPLADGASIGSDGFLVENGDTFSRTRSRSSQTSDTIVVDDWDGEAGDYIYIDGGGENVETQQVIDVQPAPAGNPANTGKTSSGFVLSLASPLQFTYPEGSSVEWIAEGSVAPPAPPWLWLVPGPEAPDTLRWFDNGASTATSFDFELANDSLFTDIILSVDDTAAYEVDVSGIAFVDFETYYWRARATNLVGAGEWSSADVFTPGTSFLPVELIDFTATVDGDAVQLAWGTASELNNAGFEVELKSADSETFEPVDFVSGAGTTNEEQSYSYRVTDLDAGRHVFRLKQVDFDGAFEYSPEIEATIELAESYHLSAAYPNPFNPQTNFTLAVRQAQDVTVDLYNAMGQLVSKIHEGRLSASETHAFTVDAGSLPSGTYMIRAQGETFSAVRRVTLLK